MPKVSVIIPVYNVEQYLEECLDSVLSQTYCDYEVIAVNDGSTDNSTYILAEYAEKNERITVISTKNQGLSVARNVGINAATGDYIIFLDSDDKFTAETLGFCVKKLEEDRLDAVFFESEVIIDGVDPDLKKQFPYQRPNVLFDKVVTGEEFFTESINSSKYIVQACMYMFSRKSLSDLRFYPGMFHEDNLFTTKLLLSGRLKRVGCLPEKFFQRRIRPGSIMTQEKSKKHLDGYLIAAKELIKEKPIITDVPAGVAITKFITGLLHRAMHLATEFNKLWVPLSLRKYVFKMALENNSSRSGYLLIIRSLSPHFYSFLRWLIGFFITSKREI